MHYARGLLILPCLFSAAATRTLHDPSPAFPVPSWTDSDDKLELTASLSTLEAELKDILSTAEYDTSSFSIEITSNTETIWSHSHTARKVNDSRPGTRQVDQNSVFRIASLTKVFTTLGILYQHQAGNISLHEPITKYIPALSGDIPWSEITLRALASQLSGIPSDFAQGELLHSLADPTLVGLPPVSLDRLDLPACDEFGIIARPCGVEDLVQGLKQFDAIFPPNQKSTYSNVGFELLGIVLERATQMRYRDYLRKAILEPLAMLSTTTDRPEDESRAVLPYGENWWDVNHGIGDPTGGIYSTASDMSKFMRYILTHYNSIATGINWIQPASWAEGINSFYGMPFETFRSDSILGERTQRPVTLVSKAGGMPGYFSRMTILPEYGLGVIILIGGELALLRELQEAVMVTVLRAAEDIVWKRMDKYFSGSYHAITPSLNSSLVLSASSTNGLVIREFISNGTDVLNDIIPVRFVEANSAPWRVQLVPTMLFKDEAERRGEIWRMMVIYDRTHHVWDLFGTPDIDSNRYAGLPINEVVFWHEDGIVEMPAWRLQLSRSIDQANPLRMVVQGSSN